MRGQVVRPPTAPSPVWGDPLQAPSRGDHRSKPRLGATFASDQGGAWAVGAMSADGANLRQLFEIGGGWGPDWTQEQISWGP